MTSRKKETIKKKKDGIQQLGLGEDGSKRYKSSIGAEFSIRPVSPFLIYNISDSNTKKWKEENEIPPLPSYEVERIGGTTYPLEHDEDSILDKSHYTSENGVYNEQKHEEDKEAFLQHHAKQALLDMFVNDKMLEAMMYHIIDFEEDPMWEDEIIHFGGTIESNPIERKIQMITQKVCGNQQDYIDIVNIMQTMMNIERDEIEEAKKDLESPDME